MLNTFFNKTTHPILNRYHHNRMTQGTNLVKEMDTMINKLTNNQTIDSVQQDVPSNLKQDSKHKANLQNNFSKGVMKRIINNQTWNDLIDRRYNHSQMNKSKSRDEINIKRTRSLNSSNVFAQTKINFPCLKPSESVANKAINKIKKGNINMIQFFTPSPKLRKKTEVSSKIKCIKSSGQYKTRQLKWQEKHLCKYDEESFQQFQTLVQ